MPKVWKDGSADDAWKIAICARDSERVRDVIMFLDAVLCEGDAAKTPEAAIERLRRLTMDEALDGLVDYHESAKRSVAKGLASVNQWKRRAEALEVELASLKANISNAVNG